MAKKMTESKKQAEKPTPTSTAKSPETANVPAIRKETSLAQPGSNKLAGRGFENLDKSDLLLPRIKLLQPLSPEINDLGQKPGTIFLGLGNKNYGNKITVIPVLHFRSRIKWIPEDENDGKGGIDCSSPDSRTPREAKYSANCATCSHQLWNDKAKIKKDKAPKCTMYDNFLCLIDGGNEPVIIPFERTKQKVAKKWYSMGALKSGSDMWAWQYELSVVGEKNDEGKPYFNYSVRDLSKATSDERQKLCLSLWESLAGKTVSEVNTEKDEPAAAGASAGAGY